MAFPVPSFIFSGAPPPKAWSSDQAFSIPLRLDHHYQYAANGNQQEIA
jgi:hypothetical protein